MSSVSPFKRWWLSSWPHRWSIRRQVPRFLKACPEPFRGQVLEVGAGGGWTSRRILETFPQVELTAIDTDPAVIQAFARLQGRFGRRLKVQAADVLHLPFDRSVFDVVLVINLLPHLSQEELPLALRQMLRVIRPGGLLGLSPASPAAEQLVSREQCQVLFIGSGRRSDIWARKPYQLA